MNRFRNVSLTLLLVLAISLPSQQAEARKRKRKYSGPPPTHPVLLWARTLSESTDREQRKIAAFKLSQYSQPIFQDEVVRTLSKCVKDSDVEIKVLCTKAMGHAGRATNSEAIRDQLLEVYKSDPSLRNTVVRVMVVREDNTPPVQNTFLDSLKKTKDPEEAIALLKYFETFGDGSSKFVDAVVATYNNFDNLKVQTAAISALTAKAAGQDAVIALFAQCTESHNTPLVLNCLAGLQQQAKKDARAWTAVEKTIQSDDPDVLVATLDVVNALPETQNTKVSERLLQLIENVDDEDVLEKSVLALGVCGDHSQSIVDRLQALLEEKSGDEGSRVAAALVLGKQADKFPDKPKESLGKCAKEEKAQSLRTACQLGLKEIETRRSMNAKADAAAQAAANRMPTDAVNMDVKGAKADERKSGDDDESKE